MCTTTGPAVPASTGQALAMVRAGLGYLAACDAGSLGTAAQAAALTGLEAAEAQHTAARAAILSAFTAQHGYEADGQYGAAAWLRAITRITRAAAGAATGWARRLAAHPAVAAALAAGQLPVVAGPADLRRHRSAPRRSAGGRGRYPAGRGAGRRGSA